MISSNIFHEQSKICRNQRNRKNGHKSFVLWFTGLSGSGKSTLSHEVEKILFEKGVYAYVLDGDNIRHGLSKDLGFDDSDRKENIRRISEVAKLMVDAGVITITSFISPFEKDRGDARKIFNKGDFIEIYCKSSIDMCELRDVKGLYKLARLGKIPNYTGIDSPYEPPTNPEIIVDTDNCTVEESVAQIINYIKDIA